MALEEFTGFFAHPWTLSAILRALVRYDGAPKDDQAPKHLCVLGNVVSVRGVAICRSTIAKVLELLESLRRQLDGAGIRALANMLLN
ncbi:uncharacterized protein LOC135122861 isoform X6 [Zophobas morio]|uniref:uncharacterized protein LOC135122861 isoform X6 n=1 Tax=Zophobas morio TaxID=2755281 RepID=UPI003083CC82